MSVFGKLLGRTSPDSRKADVAPDQNMDIAAGALGGAAASRSVELTGSAPAAAQASVNIWDLDGAPALPAPAEAAEPGARVLAGPPRKSRTKTRLLGFDKSDGRVVDLFANPVELPSQGTRFPVGWIVVVTGPGRGESYTLQAGMSQIGRGEDQAISLDFGDGAISRTNHAAIVYDPESFQFYLGHGGKSNIVRLNDKPVISNEMLKNGDLIRLGETTLRFVALCDAAFNWSDDAEAEADNVEIA